MMKPIYALAIDGVHQATGNRKRLYGLLRDYVYPDHTEEKGNTEHTYTVTKINRRESDNDDVLVEQGKFKINQGVTKYDLIEEEGTTKYIKLPLEVEAFRYLGLEGKERLMDYPDWFLREYYLGNRVYHRKSNNTLTIYTKDAAYNVEVGDYIIRDTYGDWMIKSNENFNSIFTPSESYLKTIYEDMGIRTFLETLVEDVETKVDKSIQKSTHDISAISTRNFDNYVDRLAKDTQKNMIFLGGALIVIALLINLFMRYLGG